MTAQASIDRHSVERICQDPGAVRPAFQAVIDPRSGEARGHELLAVFDGVGDIPTPAWFEAAAEYGLAGALEARIVRAALAARAQAPEGSFVAVNVTAFALGSTQLQALHRQPLDRIVLELAEGEVAQGLAETLEPFRAAGAMVAVDSCGAGATPLAEIARMQPDFLKLDRRLVSGIDRDPARVAAVQALECFGKSLGAPLAGVGVERREELDRLVELGVELVQGFLFGRRESTIARARERLVPATA